MGLRHWSGRRLAVIWLLGMALFAAELAWFGHRNRVAREQFAAKHGLHLEGDKLVPNVRSSQGLADSADAVTFVLLRQRARLPGQPLTTADSAVERFAQEWHRLPHATLDSAWRGLAIPDRLTRSQRDSLHDLLRAEVGAVANQIAAGLRRHWLVTVGLVAASALVVLAVPLGLVILTGLWIAGRQRAARILENTAA